MSIPIPAITIPSYVIKLLGSNQLVRDIAVEYFATVHTYLAIISKKIYYGLLLNPLVQRRADVAFLCLCMKLVIAKPSELNIVDLDEYVAAKQYLLELEAAGVFTLQILQGRMLMALFEFGHGVYPAAYMSVSACITHAIALRLDKEQNAVPANSTSWVEAEERRRVWWAVVILERYFFL